MTTLRFFFKLLVKFVVCILISCESSKSLTEVLLKPIRWLRLSIVQVYCYIKSSVMILPRTQSRQIIKFNKCIPILIRAAMVS